MDFQEQVKFVRMQLQLALLGKFYSFCKRNGIEIDLSDNTNI